MKTTLLGLVLGLFIVSCSHTFEDAGEIGIEPLPLGNKPAPSYAEEVGEEAEPATTKASRAEISGEVKRLNLIP
ncbi:MAG: hypothetical protein LBP34_06870 [Flavobacteriaceae bacterium]|nr:hypothetical protein [Flavobacteriaceae bacterium]